MSRPGHCPIRKFTRARGLRAAVPLLLVGLLSAAPLALSAQRGGGAPSPSGMGPGGNSFGSPSRDTLSPGHMHLPSEDHPGPHGGPPHGPFQLGPPGRWWHDKNFADLNLSSDQQKRMDTIFNSNRPTLIANLSTLHDEERRMDNLTHAASPDEAALFAEIDRIAQAHAALEKTNTHMILALRRELSPDQIARLEAHQPPDPPQ